MTTVLNTLTGIVTDQPDHIVNHITLGKYLLEVPEGTKNLVPGLFKPGTADEFVELNAKDEKAPNNSKKNGDN